MDSSLCVVNKLYPFVPNTGFVGREKEIARLEQLLFSQGGPDMVAICGLGGVGKTRLAMELIRRKQETRRECFIFWIPATNLETLERAYTQYVQALKLPGSEDSNADAKKLLQDHLNGGGVDQWLLIFDNADDEAMWFGETANLRDYIPFNRTGKVIFTTRFEPIALNLMNKDHVVKLPNEDKTMARELLNIRLKEDLSGSESERVSLLEQLTFLPLAIVQATSYMNVNTCALSKYLSLLSRPKDDLIRLWSKNFKDDWKNGHEKNPVATTWLISFEKVQSDSPLAADILSTMACTERARIPKSLLPSAPYEEEWIEAIGILKAYSFVSEYEDQMFDLHRLVHLMMWNWLERKGTLADWCNRTLETMEHIFPTSEHTNRILWNAYMPHALLLIERDKPQCSNLSHELLYKVSLCLEADGQTGKAVVLLRQRHSWMKDNLVKHHPSRLASQLLLALAYQADNQKGDAVELYEDLVAVRKATPTKNNPDWLLSLSQLMLAILYQDIGQSDGVIKLLDNRVGMQEAILAKSHPGRLAIPNVLAVAYLNDGQIDKGIKLLKQALAVEATMAKDHRNRLASQHVLAIAYAVKGQMGCAVKVLEHMVAEQKNSLAEHHPSLLGFQHLLATAYQDSGQINNAVKLLEHVVAVRKDSLAEYHPSLLDSQYSLAKAYQASAQMENAVKLFEHVVEVRNNTLAESHPTRLASQNMLTIAYLAHGRFHEGSKLLNKALEGKATMAKDHRDRLSQYVLVIAYLANGQIDNTIKLLEDMTAVKNPQVKDQPGLQEILEMIRRGVGNSCATASPQLSSM